MKKLVAASAFLGVLALAGHASAATVIVTPTSMGSWAFQTSSTATAGMETGPATPPLGLGSAGLNVGSDGNGAAQLRNSAYNGMPLDQVTGLAYSTYVEVDGSGGQAPYMLLNIDLDGNGTTDDQLFFEPVYQTGAYSGDPIPPQPAVVVGSWQTWDAQNGGWWSLNDFTFGPPLVTLESYIAENPTAALAAPASGAGSVRLVAGFGAGAWDNFEGNVDAVSINGTTFNFELGPDSCKGGRWATYTTPTFRNQGSCVQYVNTGK